MLKAVFTLILILNLFAFGQYSKYDGYSTYAGYDTVASGAVVTFDTTGWGVKQWLDFVADTDTSTTTVTDRSVNGNDGTIVNKGYTHASADSGLYLEGNNPNGGYVQIKASGGSYVDNDNTAAVLFIFDYETFASRKAVFDNRQFFFDLNDSSPPEGGKWRFRVDVYRGGWMGAKQSSNVTNNGYMFLVIDVNASANRIWAWDQTGANVYSSSTADTGNLTQADVTEPGVIGEYFDQAGAFEFNGHIHTYMMISTSQDSATYKAEWDKVRATLP